MIYTNSNGLATLDHEGHGAEVDAALEKIRQGIRELDKHYYSVDHKRLAKARAMASHLMSMLEDE
jgi:hypothetical protein